jgi:hypothetical protein
LIDEVGRNEGVKSKVGRCAILCLVLQSWNIFYYPPDI